METNNLLSIAQFCNHYKVPVSFLKSLEEVELIEIIFCNEEACIQVFQIAEIEKMIRLHFELNINIEGLDAVNNLLNQIEYLKNENLELKNKLQIYESN